MANEEFCERYCKDSPLSVLVYCGPCRADHPHCRVFHDSGTEDKELVAAEHNVQVTWQNWELVGSNRAKSRERYEADLDGARTDWDEACGTLRRMRAQRAALSASTLAR